MKRLLLYLLGGTILFTACQREEIAFGTPGEESPVAFEVRIPQQSLRSRAAGDGANINRCILEIYLNGELYLRQVKAVTGGTVSFDDLRLVSSQKYDLLFWADKASTSNVETDGKYKTKTAEGLRAITYASSIFTGNDESYDAFCARETLTVSGAFTKTVTLKRPFAQVNVTTLDLGSITLDALKPDKVKAIYASVPTSLNLLTGEVGGMQQLGYSSSAAPVDASADASGAQQFARDYIFAPENEDLLIDFSLEFYKSSTLITTNAGLTNIPLRRNSRTMVSGNLLTKKGQIGITVSPDFDEPDKNYTVAEEPTPASVAEKMVGGSTVGKITEPVSDGSKLDLSDIISTANGIDAATPLELHFTQGVTAAADDTKTEVVLPEEYAGTLSIYVPTTENANSLKITAPNATVSIKGNYDGIDLATGPHTGIVEADAAIGTLNVLKGNIEIRGSVTTLTIDAAADTQSVYLTGSGTLGTLTDNTGKVSVTSVWDGAWLKEIALTTENKVSTYRVRYASELAWLFANAKTGNITLYNDIDLDNKPWTPHKSYSGTFDGAGHTIRNLFIDKLGTSSVGFFGYSGNSTIKDITFRDATIKGGQYCAVVSGSSYSKMDNVVVDGCNIICNNWKVGGLIGQWNEGDICIANCTVRNTSIHITGTSTCNYCGGLAGFANTSAKSGTVRAKNCTVDNVTISAESGKFVATSSPVIGCVMANSAYTFALENITVTNVTLPATTDSSTRVCDYVGGFDWRGAAAGFAIAYNGETIYQAK